MNYIIDKLNGWGIVTRRGNTFSKSTLNEKYIGTYTYVKGTKRNHHAILHVFLKSFSNICHSFF